MNYIFEILLFAFTIFSESSGEGVIGMQATANVISNRVYSKYYPDDYYSVVFQPFQFSCFNNEAHISRNLGRIWKNEREFTSFIESLVIAIKTHHRTNCIDTTDGAIYYMTLDTHKKWTNDLTFIKNIGNHKFYK